MADPVTTKPLLTGTAGLIVGTVGMALAALSALLPQPWVYVAGIVAMLLCGLAGVASPTPTWAEGKPVLQGSLATAASALLGLLVTFAPSLPPQFLPIAAAVGGLLAFLIGKPMPALGSPSHEKLVKAETAGAVAVANAATEGKVDKLETLTGIGKP